MADKMGVIDAMSIYFINTREKRNDRVFFLVSYLINYLFIQFPWEVFHSFLHSIVEKIINFLSILNISIKFSNYVDS